MKNADKIRSMTDEELCEFLENAIRRCYNCGAIGTVLEENVCGEECPMCEDVYNWLQKEAGEDK